MHELSIAASIVDLAQEEAEKRAVRIVAIHLTLGALSGVVREALEGSYEMVSAGTKLEGSRLVIREQPVRVYCPVCREPRDLPSIQLFVCPACNSPAGEVIDGRELLVTALEVES
ncbi:MAG: hydrogenase expression/synthesis, HypA [Candidatus Solibacter sp.]|jgi:hydrogenase nickel incorporation protein HypA/HybF|nr:hydrogenase expression/synthesis, HypA [Candidatus Solibacter sp.]